MFNLLITADEGAWDRPDYSLDRSRYLEYTETDVADGLRVLDDGTIARLKLWPTLFAYESAVNLAARVGWLQTVAMRRNEIRVTFRFDAQFPPIPPETIEAMSWDLDVRGWELSRTHWAVKQVDLLAVLRGESAKKLDDTRAPYALGHLTEAEAVTGLAAVAPERELETVAKSVRDCIERGEPAVGLDRLHTFATALARSLCARRQLPTSKDLPLHSLFGSYVKHLRQRSLVESEMGEAILKYNISILEKFNDVRNNYSLAHDNPLLKHDEALLIMLHVVNLFRFVQEVERRSG